MTNHPSRPIRARKAEEKQQRRTEILRAAERLWVHTPYSELSMNQVAREAQLAKGTLYLYYDTKEELFLALLSEHLQLWFTGLFDRLRAEPSRTPKHLTDVFLATIPDSAALRRLLVLLSTVLERNVNPQSGLEFRRLVRRNIYEASQLLGLSLEKTVQVLAHLNALVVGWHQSSEDRSLAYTFEAGELPNGRPDFMAELALALRTLMPVLLAEDTGTATGSVGESARVAP